MTATLTSRLRKQLPGAVALLMVVGMFFIVRLPEASAADKAELARKYAFQPMNIALPSGFRQQTIRRVNKEYKHIDAWISSVGAGIAMNDLDGDGLPNDLCVTDPRIDQVVVTPAPGARAQRYTPFALSSGSLPMNDAMAPMGCAPGDFNEDGRMDLLVYLWGRTPIVHLAKPDAAKLTADAYVATELVPNAGGATYTGPEWNSNAVSIADFDGDGHEDIYLGNYFPHGPVLDDRKRGGVSMNRSLSAATNGGEDYFFRWTGARTGERPSATFQRIDNAVPGDISRGWVLAAAANDLDGDQLSELYIAQDHGKDALLHNISRPGKIEFAAVHGVRTPGLPKSKRIGEDSFKGMGIDFADFDHDGLYDMFVSNITTTFGIQESNFQFMNTAKDQADLRAKLGNGVGPWEDRSTNLGTAWSGWAWDVKVADFNNSGESVIAQTTGFVKGEVNRWPQLQELAATNDLATDNPYWWPYVQAGDDIAGSQRLAFFVCAPDGRYQDLAHELGLAIPVPTRGIAVGDADGDGRLDMAVARQWDEPVFYQNTSPAPGAYLGLQLTHDTESPEGAMPAQGSPVVGAQVTVTTPDGRKHLARVDGGSGHSGKRSHEVHVGLGSKVTGPVQVHLTWRDRSGQVREQNLQLNPGRHALRLGSQAKER
ncbi:RNA-binding protein [Microtetraspora sp. NBRC 13810]|uniref:CRTAC1 family protein n=1 Tax=Microtetraspora sp. NBRC 13810 TaxID=3030990 RepID=UPI0024A29E72|nr:CRTAC1 family protein [Microtetraspora sp. NBRC 13810]GLW05815.1 RNA-binding protein [Microtetraspora sp. NBRC 13810]